MTTTNSQLANLKIKLDYYGNPYVLVNDKNSPAVYYTVYLTMAEQPEGTEARKVHFVIIQHLIDNLKFPPHDNPSSFSFSFCTSPT